MIYRYFLGLDVSKCKIDCYVFAEKHHHFVIENNQVGFDKLLSNLKKIGLNNVEQIHACCEATNIYYFDLACYLNNVGMAVSVVNPSVIKSYAKIQLSKTKTDKQDAKLIARFCEREQPKLWQPPCQKVEELKGIYRRIEQLNKILVSEKNSSYVVRNAESDESIKRVIECVNKELGRCRAKMEEIVKSDENLKQKHGILKSIIGVGNYTAMVLLCLMMEIDKFPTARHLISWLGLSPAIRQSGKFKGAAKLSKMGDSTLRKALYMPARVACTRSKFWRSWFDGHIARGKHAKQVYVMMMVKIVKYAYACVKKGQMFDVERHKALSYS